MIGRSKKHAHWLLTCARVTSSSTCNCKIKNTFPKPAAELHNPCKTKAFYAHY